MESTNHLSRIPLHINGVLTHQNTIRSTASGASYNELFTTLLHNACRALALDTAYAQKILHCDFPRAKITAHSVVELYQETDRVVEVCDEARRRLVFMEWSGNSKEFAARLKEDISVRAEMCRESLLISLSEPSDPRAILRMFHYRHEIRATIQHMNIILGLDPEPVGGDVEKHATALNKEFDAGGWMYQATDLHSMRDLFSLLRLKSNISFYDLGSGYGHPIFYGANLREDLNFTGIELMPARVDACNQVAGKLRLSNVSFQLGDVTKRDISEADVVFLFNPFPPSVKREVAQKLCSLARTKPIVVLDYDGLVTDGSNEFRRMDKGQAVPFHVYGSRKYFDDSISLAGISAKK